MQKDIPSYIQKSFKDTIKDHYDYVLKAGTLDKEQYRELRDQSLKALTSLESAKTIEDRDAIFENINNSDGQLSKAIFNVVAATNHYMWSKGISIHTQNKSPAPTDKETLSL